MEKPARSKGNEILKYLKKPSSFSISVAPQRPEKSSKPKQLPNRAFSGPLLAVVPAEARRRNRSGGRIDTPEPTSPKVSCIGQIKRKKSNRSRWKPPPAVQPATARRAAFVVRKMFQRKVLPGRRSKEARKTEGGAKVAPALGQMRKFASRRETLAGFDWTKAVEEEEEEEEVIVSHSAPIVMGGAAVVAVEPRKEVNLWKRRTVTAPITLRLE